MTIDEFFASIKNKLPPAPAEELERLERTVGYSLPDDYRRFLVACNGGSLGGSLWFKGPTPEGRDADAGIHHIGGFRKEGYFSLFDARECYQGRIPRILLSVMDDPFSDLVAGLAPSDE